MGILPTPSHLVEIGERLERALALLAAATVAAGVYDSKFLLDLGNVERLAERYLAWIRGGDDDDAA